MLIESIELLSPTDCIVLVEELTNRPSWCRRLQNRLSALTRELSTGPGGYPSDMAQEPHLPQLRMVHRLGALPPERPLPAGYRLRQATQDDAAAIGRVLEAAFEVPWTADKVLEELFQNDSVPATFVVENEDGIVAAASYQLKSEPDPEAAWLHWVGALPSEAGKGLGEIVSRRVLQEALDQNRSGVYLTTDDFRLPAIRTYLRLGFEPDHCHESHPERWAALAPADRRQ